MDWQYIYDRLEILGIEPPDDIDLSPLIDRIWNEVKRNRVVYLWSKIETVSGRSAYDIPSEDISGNEVIDARVSEVYWNPRPSNRSYTSEIWDTIRNATIEAVMDSLFDTSWELVSGKIYLSPAPSESGVEVPVLIYRSKEDEEANENDLEAVLQGILWIMYERVCTSVTRGSSFRAGSYAQTASPSSVSHLKSRAEFHKDQYKMLLEDNEGVVTF